MKQNQLKIGTILRKYRKKGYFTQEQLAELCDVTPGFLGQVERDETYPSINTLAKIIQNLNMDANVIFYPNDEKPELELELLHQEAVIRFSKLKTNHQKIILRFMQQLLEIQEEETTETE